MIAYNSVEQGVAEILKYNYLDYNWSIKMKYPTTRLRASIARDYVLEVVKFDSENPAYRQVQAHLFKNRLLINSLEIEVDTFNTIIKRANILQDATI